MQAARGTSVVDADTPAPRRHPLLFVAVALAAYAADVLTKVWAVVSLRERDVPVVGDLLVLHLTRNPGAAFSTGTGFTVALSCVAIAAVVVVLVLARRARTRVWTVALALLLGGVAGNLTDRLVRSPGPLRGHVVDFLMLPHWPVFNLADVCINVAAGLILLQAMRGVRMNGERHES